MLEMVSLEIKDKGIMVEVNQGFLHLLNMTFTPQMWWLLVFFSLLL